MAADAFQGYQREYLALRSSVQGKLDQQIPALRGGASPPLPVRPTQTKQPCSPAEERKAAIRRVNMELDEVDEIVSPVPPPAQRPCKEPPLLTEYRPLHRSTNSNTRAKERRNSWLKCARIGKKRNHGKRKRSVRLSASPLHRQRLLRLLTGSA